MQEQMNTTLEASALATLILCYRHQVRKEKLTLPAVGEVWVYGLTQGELGQYRRDIRQADGQVDLATSDIQFFWRVLRDEKGKRIFDATQCQALMDLPAEIVRPVIAVGERLCGLTAEAQKDLEKNSGTPAQTAGD
jgi:hypothetical protein